MDKMFDNAKRLLEKEITEIGTKNELSPSSLEVMYKVTDILKDIETICAMREAEEYSSRMPYYMYEEEGMSNARGRGRNARRDSMGRYSRDSYDNYSRNSYDGYSRNSYDGYSRDDELEEMMRDAKTEKERDLIRQLIDAKKHN